MSNALYIVHKDWSTGKTSVVSEEIVKETKKTIRIRRGRGAAFNYATLLSKNRLEDRGIGRTPEEAVALNLRYAMQAVEDAKEELVTAEAELAIATALVGNHDL